MARLHAHMATFERPSGVPPPGKLGASRNEMFALLLATLVFAAILLSFWIESHP